MLKVNQMILKWKEGEVHGLGRLTFHDIGQQLAFNYCKRGYLRKVVMVFTQKQKQKVRSILMQ